MPRRNVGLQSAKRCNARRSIFLFEFMLTYTEMEDNMTKKQFLAGLAAEVLYRLQVATAGRCGGFGLYNALWRVYTAEYTIRRGGLRWDIKHG